MGSGRRRRLRNRRRGPAFLDPPSSAQLDPPTATPDSWRGLVWARMGRGAPELLTDGTEPTYRPWDAGAGDPDDAVDRAVAATRRAVFPEHGLDPFDPR
jgi:acetoin utilization protein AcuC